MDNDEIQVFYPVWIKVAYMVGMPLVFVAGLWMLLRPIWEAGLTNEQNIFFPLVSCAVFYQCFFGLKYFRYLSMIVVLHDDGIDVYHNGTTKEYLWKELEVKEYSFATTTQIKHQNGQTIAYFVDRLPNLKVLTEIIRQGGP